MRLSLGVTVVGLLGAARPAWAHHAGGDESGVWGLITLAIPLALVALWVVGTVWEWWHEPRTRSRGRNGEDEGGRR
jgi:hypothetical protein